MDDAPRATQLLQRMRGGDDGAAGELLPLVQTELHRLAERAMAGQRRDHTLQPTALVNEAWIRLVGAQGDVHDREHFLALAASAMRSVLVDHVRRRSASKRPGGAEKSSLDEVVIAVEERAFDLLALDEALGELAEADARLARIVELHFFGGLEHRQIAALQEVSVRTVERDWSAARAWLRQRLAPQED